jgi:hypothetical protein
MACHRWSIFPRPEGIRKNAQCQSFFLYINFKNAKHLKAICFVDTRWLWIPSSKKSKNILLDLAPWALHYRKEQRKEQHLHLHAHIILIFLQDCQTGGANWPHRSALVFGKNQPGISQLKIDYTFFWTRYPQSWDGSFKWVWGWVAAPKEPLHDCNFIRPILFHFIFQRIAAPCSDKLKFP